VRAGIHSSDQQGTGLRDSNAQICRCERIGETEEGGKGGSSKKRIDATKSSWAWSGDDGKKFLVSFGGQKGMQ